MEQLAHLSKNELQENYNEDIENKNEKKGQMIRYKNLSNENLCEPFYFNQEEFRKRRISMKYSNLQNKLLDNNLLRNSKKQKTMFNFVGIENKNKNLKVADSAKIESNLNNNNNNNSYYINRKYSRIIFDRFNNNLNSISEENYLCPVINICYFCTKINIIKEKNVEKVDNVEKIDNVENIEKIDNAENIDNVENIEKIDNVENIDNNQNIENIDNNQNVENIDKV